MALAGAAHARRLGRHHAGQGSLERAGDHRRDVARLQPGPPGQGLRIVVASAATNWFGHEGSIPRFVFKHSITLACLVGVLVMLQAYVFTGMIVHP